MDDRTKRARDYLKALITEDSLKSLLESLLLTKFERDMLYSIYRDGRTLGFVADSAGYSLGTIKRMHRCALLKVCAYLDTESK